jgi:hypothetical protein
MNGVVKRGGGGYLHPHQFTMTLEARTGVAAGREGAAWNYPATLNLCRCETQCSR